ncbi:ecdysone oxidase [Bombyx mori]|uniref:Glucose-methanol-choline oxidoreductase N-terminal domain-containing protein n=1 Tax=Bombyx mori TaxID=7091 RepID=A0A8R2HRC3_BOMMO|nr:L-sorbose 1-dehydrogenase [Bombyx mori]
MASSFLANLLVESTYLPLETATTIITMAGLFKWPPQATVNDGDCFDFIVIGSGVGAVIANRLTENEDVRVLLIEAGKNPSVESMLPGLFILLQNSYQDWNYVSEPEEATKNQQVGAYRTSAGKCLGGSSNINHFIHLRGDPCDFDSWAAYLKDESWSYKNVLPYFRKSETVQDEDILKYYANFHGVDGPVIITRQPDDSTRNIMESFEEIGVPSVLDLNTNNTVGFTESSFIIGNGRRQSTSQAYLNNLKRDNLYVLTETVAEKIIFEDNVAVGVILRLGSGEKITVYANREVIVSAGTFNSPKLLMLSGIGPAEELQKFGIDVIKDLPVGKDMQDHFAVLLLNKLERSIEISQIPQLTRLAFPVLLGGINLDGSKCCPDYQIIGLKFTHDTPYFLLTCTVLFGLKHEICSKLNAETIGRNHLVTFIGAFHPESRGYVKLRSADPNDDPIISQSFYSNAKDFDNMKKYVKHFLTVYNSSYFREINAEVADPGLDECGEMSLDNEDYLECYIKGMTVTIFHQTSTCAMGSVVDSNMQVYGVENLRVIDASTMPNITRANTLAASIMMAEKMSDVIKNKYNL